ncbi:pyridoxal-dependent decarboxylase [Conexibacter sp. JD483]|uniref:pyridoxal phosphate-dependent decarboxylase family protein n=1 Tax=unclassified Conexibacter TaxID=2627773 RepID=UPI002721A4A4|nr:MULTISPECIES: pyridoxal-dependent decarboxylase [unclassified Conexibacter]MDO8185288.1 pyridoxal-dependent decarboxylase [Conexibacter sp. CPCC 205706]MDO8198334.1 pyridoxal-dependent decarboxylase [Conexibacter sp. CPCC 205762]MDR9370521.1 pyridoxal-dependent decarboxylase [Conexibacter sp. JD483]
MTSPLALPDREQALAHAASLVLDSWRDFDRARPLQPQLNEALRRRLDGPLPEQGADADESLTLAAEVLDASLSQPRPRYLAYVGSSGLEIGVLGDALAAAHDINAAVATGGADLFERQALRWLAELIGFGQPFDGVFAAGGTISNLTALAAAREQALPGFRWNGGDGRPLALYCSADAHYSVRRAAELLGIGGRNVRALPLDERRRLSAPALAQTLRDDLRAGVVPVAVVATTGTTLTGAVDPLDALADICAEHCVWLHVDGAYGLPAAATASARPLFAGLERVDSATVDAHKWLSVPKACSVLLVRDGAALERTFGHRESYMPHDAAPTHPVDRTLEYSRPLRALKLWLAFRVHGAAAFRAAIERNLAQAALLWRLLSDHPRLEPLHEPELSALCFRHVSCASGDAGADRAATAALVRAIEADGRIYLAAATLDGVPCLRACFVNHRTTDADVAAVVEVVDELACALAAVPSAAA